MTMSTSSHLASFTQTLIKLAPECEKILMSDEVSPLESKAYHAHCELAVRARYLRPTNRQRLWSEHVIAFNKNCLNEMVKLIAMQRENICYYKRHGVKAGRGIPALNEGPQEAEFYHKLTAQWHTVLMQTREQCMMLKHKRTKNFPAEALELERELILRRTEVLNLVKETSIIRGKLLKSIAKIKASLKFATAMPSCVDSSCINCCLKQ